VRRGPAGHARRDRRNAAVFLTGPEARYINGTDLLVDGGQAAGMRRHMRRPG
jgi:NAD(P)-dependent dehydrogenase (short-subunit alcohol dehydrogenase family)